MFDFSSDDGDLLALPSPGKKEEKKPPVKQGEMQGQSLFSEDSDGDDFFGLSEPVPAPPPQKAPQPVKPEPGLFDMASDDNNMELPPPPKPEPPKPPEKAQPVEEPQPPPSKPLEEATNTTTGAAEQPTADTTTEKKETTPAPAVATTIATPQPLVPEKIVEPTVELTVETTTPEKSVDQPPPPAAPAITPPAFSTLPKAPVDPSSTQARMAQFSSADPTLAQALSPAAAVTVAGTTTATTGTTLQTSMPPVTINHPEIKPLSAEPFPIAPFPEPTSISSMGGLSGGYNYNQGGTTGLTTSNSTGMLSSPSGSPTSSLSMPLPTPAPYQAPYEPPGASSIVISQALMSRQQCQDICGKLHQLVEQNYVLTEEKISWSKEREHLSNTIRSQMQQLQNSNQTIRDANARLQQLTDNNKELAGQMEYERNDATAKMLRYQGLLQSAETTQQTTTALLEETRQDSLRLQAALAEQKERNNQLDKMTHMMNVQATQLQGKLGSTSEHAQQLEATKKQNEQELTELKLRHDLQVKTLQEQSSGQLEKLTTNNNNLRSELTSTQGQLNSLESKHQALTSSYQSSVSSNKELQAANKELTSTLADTKKGLESELASTKQEYEQQIAEMTDLLESKTRILQAQLTNKTKELNEVIKKLEKNNTALSNKVEFYSERAVCTLSDFDRMNKAEMEKEIRNLQNKLAEFQKIQRCLLCQDKPRTVTLRPCKHMPMCDSCAQNEKYCPICKVAITARQVAGGKKELLF